MSRDFAERVRVRVREDRLLAGAEVLVAAVSGGLDSMVMLHLLRHGGVAPSGASLVAVHFDHRMRAGSGADAEWVAGVCSEWGVACRLRRAPRPVRTEAEGRRLRHAGFAALACELGESAVVLTAHTADDQAETVLFRAARGSGPRGAAGIRPVRERVPRIARPLLPFRRSELEAYAAARGVPFRDDPTNRDPRWTRNRIRHRVLPELEKAVPGAAMALAHLADASRVESTALDLLLDERMESMSARPPAGSARGFSFKRAELAALPGELAAVLLRRAVARLGGEAGRGATRDLLRFARESGGGREVTLAGGVVVSREGGRVHLRPPAQEPPTGAAGPRAAAPGPPGRVVYTASEIAARVGELGRRIGEAYEADDGLLLLATLKGSFIFAADLARAITIPVQLDFLAAASYGKARASGGEVRILKRHETPIGGRHVVLVEDIVDSGGTLDRLIALLEGDQPASLEVCALLHKRLAEPARDVRWVGFEAPREFLVGYGLDFGEDFRHLPYIRSL